MIVSNQKILKSLNFNTLMGKSKTLGLSSVMFISLSACSVDEGTLINTKVALPENTSFSSFYCQDVGIKDDNCILNDPANPFAKVDINDNNKWALNDAANSELTKFYLWATAQAKNPTGENQFYTALSLHQLYANINNDTVADHAKKAYRSVLDNYFDATTAVASTEVKINTHFTFSNWDSGTEENGNYTADSSYSPVWEIKRVSKDNDWGAVMAFIFTGTDATTRAASFQAHKYKELLFKIRSTDGSTFKVQFADGTSKEIIVGLASGYNQLAGVTVSDIAGKTDWHQVTIDLNTVFPDRATNGQFAIYEDGNFAVGNALYITDVALRGNNDSSASGVYRDTNNDGIVYLIATGDNVTYEDINLRNWVGGKLIEPHDTTEKQLYSTTAAATTELTKWGYNFNTATKLLTKN